MTRISRSVAWLPPAVARLTVGVVFALSGWGKLHKPGGGSEPSGPGESPRPGWDKFRK